MYLSGLSALVVQEILQNKIPLVNHSGLSVLVVLEFDIKQKTPCISTQGLVPPPFTLRRMIKIGIVLLSQVLDQVPSAQVGLTSLFGMGRGDPHRNKRHKGI